MQEEVQNTTQAPSVAPAPVEATPPPPPAPEAPQEPRKSHKMMFIFTGILVVAVLVLATAGYFYYKNSYHAPVDYNSTQVEATPTVSPTPEPLSQIQDANDIDKIENELNTTTGADLQSDLDKANSEGSNL